jgi:hypothetical protein
MKRMSGCAAAVAVAVSSVSFSVSAQVLRPDQIKFREIYKELVETNTTLSSGSCTLAADRVAARLKLAGYPDAHLHPFAVPDHPRKAGWWRSCLAPM